MWGVQNTSDVNKNEFLQQVINQVNVVDDDIADVVMASGDTIKCFYEFQYRFKYLQSYYLQLQKPGELDVKLSLQISDSGIIVSYPVKYDVMGTRYYVGYMDKKE